MAGRGAFTPICLILGTVLVVIYLLMRLTQGANEEVP
jgi:flagellar biogenesis protein FliO